MEVSSELRFRRVSIMTRQVSYADVILRYKASSIPSTNCVKGVRVVMKSKSVIKNRHMELIDE